MTQQDPQYYIQGVLKKNRRLLSQTITLIESSLEEHKAISKKVIEGLIPYTGGSIRLGITGVPGAGKSTFIENLGTALVKKGHKVAVLAIDPSSNRAGGSILGDKTRMGKLVSHENTFIRPSPSGLSLGGVGSKTRESMLVVEAAGYDVVIIETVGVGQSETSVATMVDFYLALMIAGAGDELQGIKKGVLEVADAIAINKADGENMDQVARAKHSLEMAMQMIMTPSFAWRPPVLSCSSVIKNGSLEVWNIVLAHQKEMKRTGQFEQKRREQSIEWMWALVKEGLKSRFNENESISGLIPFLSKKVSEDLISPSAAAGEMLALL